MPEPVASAPGSPERPLATADPAELRRAVEALHVAAFGWAMTCTGRKREDAEEVLQSAYVEVLGGRARFDGRSTFKTWLFGVIRITARSYRRRAILRLIGWERVGRAERSAHVEAPAGIDDVVGSERARAVADALGSLSARQREVLHLVFYEEMTVREAANAMGVTAGSASLHYDRGKKSLAAILRQRGFEP